MHHRTTHRRSTRTRLLRAAVAVTAGAALALGVGAPLATAAGPHVIDGGGTAYNDWGDEGTLSVNSHAKSNATRLWQTVLYADGAEWKDANGVGHAFTQADIDGCFGWKTRSATKWWQAEAGLEDVDGIVGKETFGYADEFLDGPRQRQGDVRRLRARRGLQADRRPVLRQDRRQVEAGGVRLEGLSRRAAYGVRTTSGRFTRTEGAVTPR